MTKSYRYDAFGVEKDIDDSDTNAFRYCGEYFDTETGTIYLRARHYNPTTGRFISRDSFAGRRSDPLSLNLYTYCHNNPIRYIDPSGHGIFSDIFDFIFGCEPISQEPLVTSKSKNSEENISSLTSQVIDSAKAIGKTVSNAIAPQKTTTTYTTITKPKVYRPTNASKQGQNLIKAYDSADGISEPHLKAYRDIYDVKTIGWGYTGQMIEDNVPDYCTIEEAEEFFQSDLSMVTNHANEIIKESDPPIFLTQQQYDAAVMYGFQMGPYKNSENESYCMQTLMETMAFGTEEGVYNILLGDADNLVGRRMDEFELYKYGDYNRDH